MQLDQLTKQQRQYVEAIVIYMSKHGIDIDESTTYPRSLLRSVSLDLKGKIWIPNWITHDLSRRAGRGVFLIPEVYEHLQQGEDETAGAEGSVLVTQG